MVQPQQRVHFAGLDGSSDASLPDYYKNQYGITADDCLPFSQVIRADPQDGGLFSADVTDFSWQFPLDGLDPAFVADLNDNAPEGLDVTYDEDGTPWVQSDRFNAVYSPEKVQMWLEGQFQWDADDPLFEDQRGAFIDPLWKTATTTYAVINPVDGYGPLEDTIREFGLEDAFYGNFRLYKNGGAFYLDGLFNDEQATIDPEGVDDPLKIGFESGGDFFGNTAFFAQGFAQRTSCTNSMRSLTDKLKRRHVSPKGNSGLGSKNFDEWWAYLLRQALGVKTDLEDAISDAMEVEVPLPELPFDLEDFFNLYGFPAQDFAPQAKIYAESEADDKWHPTMWDLHNGVTAVLEHEWDHTEGSQFQQYVRMGNDLLFNPALSLQQVENAYERRIQEQVGDAEDQGTLQDETGLAQIEEYRASLAEQADEWEERQDRLQSQMAVEDGDEVQVPEL